MLPLKLVSLCNLLSGPVLGVKRSYAGSPRGRSPPAGLRKCVKIRLKCFPVTLRGHLPKYLFHPPKNGGSRAPHVRGPKRMRMPKDGLALLCK